MAVKLDSLDQHAKEIAIAKMAPVVKLMDHVTVMMDILVQNANTQ